jgi:hypothetical protein
MLLGIDVKRGVASTLERVFNRTGNRFEKLEILWSGKTAGIIFKRSPFGVNAKVLFPNIDETKRIPHDVFNNLIGYALHELGHAWFTNNAPWDNAREKHGKFVNNLINGLEDPRIEKLVIESGRAPNSRALFENLLNSVLKRDGYVQPDDKKNIPFLLAVEGRRLNGYNVCVPSIVNDSPYRDDIRWALKRAHVAKSTDAIVKIAIELFNRLREHGKDEGQGDGQQDGQQQDGQDGQQDGNKPDGKQDGQGDKQDGQQDGQPSNEQGGQPSDGQGQDGEPSDGQGKQSADGNQDGEQSGEQSDEQSEDGKNGSGKADESFNGGRDVEPSGFIEDSLGSYSNTVDLVRPRPCVGKPQYETFEWR